MNSLILIATICLFLMSLIAGLILTFLASRLKVGDWNRIFSLHLLLLLSSLLLYLFVQKPSSLYQMSILLSFCSALLISGWGLRAAIPLWKKLWTSLSLAALPLFIFSPALLFYIISGNLGQFQPEVRFSLGGSYYLVEQGSMLEKDKQEVEYKLIRRYGFFNRTLARNLSFGGPVDSISVNYMQADSFNVMGRSSANAEWISASGAFRKGRGGLTQVKTKTNKTE